MIHDKTTIEERKDRGRTKDIKFRKLLKEISYKDEGEPFLKSLTNACLKRLQSRDNYQVL